MNRVSICLLRGVCQIPGYVAYERGFFAQHGIQARLEIQPTAWLIPERLLRGECQFAVIPWTRVAAASALGEDLVLVCGSGCEEAAIVVRQGLTLGDVKTLAVPQEGGIKDLTAQALAKSLGWEACTQLRMPSGDGAILALVGQGADAASMVEPYATMLQHQEIGTIVRRTGDVWPGAPGCSLTTTHRLMQEQPEVVERVVSAFVQAAQWSLENLDAAAKIAAPYIGVSERFIRAALNHNRPNIDALFNQTAMEQIIELMRQRGYLQRAPREFLDLRYLQPAGA